jgi:excisionase family DNA binding protein
MLINKVSLFASEATTLFECSTQHIYKLIHNRSLPAYKEQESTTWHIPEQSIQDYIDSRMSSEGHRK